jgi:LysM repeat protein
MRLWNRNNLAAGKATRAISCVALFAVLVLTLAACDSGLTSSGERVRLVITPVATPTQTPPAQPTAAPVSYVVKSGDTLSGIAALFGVSVDDIVRANNIADPNSLAEGQSLTIPVRPAPSTPGVEGTPQTTSTPGTPGAQSTQTPGAGASPTLPPPGATPPQGPDVPDPPQEEASTPGPGESPTIVP